MIWKPGDRAIISMQATSEKYPGLLVYRGQVVTLTCPHESQSGYPTWWVQAGDGRRFKCRERRLIPIDDGREKRSWEALKDIWRPKGVEV